MLQNLLSGFMGGSGASLSSKKDTSIKNGDINSPWVTGDVIVSYHGGKASKAAPPAANLTEAAVTALEPVNIVFLAVAALAVAVAVKKFT